MANYRVPTGYDVFWDNGKWVAIRSGKIRRNVAPYNCQTKIGAIEAAREDLEILKSDGIKLQDAR